ncbi:hypothetical protein RB195_014793 [Necator americanus]|uniref:aECM cysteine-cradle domain-containing protein n=1 Tax=Necator americanus TaxID=51031 RepID=A0ABR1E3C7_NECAM
MVEGIVATDNDALQKEKEAQELARTIELEQQKIQQLKEERERIAKQKKEQIERLKKEQAIEQARIEAARAQRKRMEMLEEQRRKLAEAKKERERQEKMLADLERQKQREIERLQKEKEKQRQKLEEERRHLLEEEQRRKKEEEEQKREEEERKRRLEEQEEEEERRHSLEEERRQEEAEQTKIEEKGREQEHEEYRRVKETGKQKRKEKEERKQKREHDKERSTREEERLKQEQEEELREDLQRRLQTQSRIEEGEKRRTEEGRGEKIPAKRAPFPNKEIEVKLKEGDRENSNRISSIRKVPKELEYKIERRRQELLTRFGSQALTNNSQNDIWRKYTAANGVEPKEERDTAPSIASSVDDSNQENSVDPAYFEDTERYNPPVESSTYLAVSDLPKCIIKTAAINFLKIKKKRKNKKRKSRRKAHGTKTLSSTKWKHGKELTYDKVSSFSVYIEEQAPATFLGKWAEPSEEPYLKVFPSMTPEPSSPKTLAVVVQPTLRSESNSEDHHTAHNTEVVVSELPQPFNKEQYLREYYEKYYKEWYRQHNEANTVPSVGELPQNRRKISIQLGKNSVSAEESVGEPVVEKSYGDPPQVETNAANILSAEQLNSICVNIQKTTQSFGIKDPRTFALNNCSLIKIYYKQVTCEQINHVMEYCEQSSFFV